MLSQASLMPQWVKKKKKSTCNARDTGDMDLTPELGRSPGGGKRRPTPVSLPEKVP